MASEVNNYIVITIPALLAQRDLPVQDAIKELTSAVGGVTRTEARGGWYSDAGTYHDEAVFQFKWNFSGPQFPRVETLSRRLVDVLFAAGEECVFKERNYNVKGKSVGYRGRLLYPRPN